MFLKNEILKGTVCVISSDTSCKDGDARFTRVPLNALSNKVWISVDFKSHYNKIKRSKMDISNIYFKKRVFWNICI